MFDLHVERVFDTVVHSTEHVFVSHPTRTVIVDGVPPAPSATDRGEEEGATMPITRSAPVRVVMLFTVIVALAVIVLATSVGASSAGAVGEPTVSHRVEAGDTLWGIAEEYAAPGGDVRRLVFDIKRLNDVPDSVIVPGQDLRIPVGG